MNDRQINSGVTSPVPIRPARGPLNARVRIPGSKSLTNRALMTAALAKGTSVLSNALFAEDTERMIDTLRRLGFAVSPDPRGRRIEVSGCGGFVPAGEAECYCGNSGTTIRFCAALAGLGQGRYMLDGVERMRRRPIGPLVEALRALGAYVEYDGQQGFPPITIRASGLASGTVHFDRPVSSQFVSALLMAAPAAHGDVMIDVAGGLISAPYVAMTTALMAEFGPVVIEDVTPSSAKFIIPAPQAYVARNYSIEPDASNASYFLAAAAVAGGTVTVEGLGTRSIQGDVRFVDVLQAMGCAVERHDDRLTVHGPPAGSKLAAVDLDLNDMPDMVPTLAVLALFADGPMTINNVANLRVKETDRLAALNRELTALGARVDERDDGLTIHPPERIHPAAINTYDDHRMAMSFALVGLAVDGIVINDPGCVAKTYPDFFDRWAGLTGS